MFSKFNNRLAVIITAGVGTMVCAYLFTLLALTSLPAAIKTHSIVVIVGWVAQTLLQLVLLPVIIVGQNLQSKKQEEHTQALKDLKEAHENRIFHLAKDLRTEMARNALGAKK